MFKGEPAIHYSHNVQTIKVVEVTMQNPLSLGVWTQRAHAELKWPWFLLAQYVFLSVLCPYHSQPGSTPSLWLPKIYWVCHAFPQSSRFLCWRIQSKEQHWWQLHDMYTIILLYHASGRCQSLTVTLCSVELGCCKKLLPINWISCTKAKHYLILMHRTDQ